MKTVLKVLYFALAVFIAVIVGIYGYNLYGYSFIQDKTTAAVNDKNYVELAKIHGSCFDKTPVAVNNNDKFDLVIFESSTLSKKTIYSQNDKGEEVVETKNDYRLAYNILLFNIKFDYSNIDNGTGSENKTALRFYAGTEYFDYVLTQNSTINKNHYIEKPATERQYLMNASRDYFTYYDSWKVLSMSLTEDLADEIANTLSAKIDSMAIVDNGGNEIANSKTTIVSDSANLFKGDFFTDVTPLVTNYNEYLDAVAKGGEEQTAGETKFNEFYSGKDGQDGFEKTFLANGNYSFRYSDAELQPSTLIWQTVGILALFAVCVALLYMLLFHFKFLKRLIFREKKGDKKEDYRVRNKKIMEDYKKRQAMDATITEAPNTDSTDAQPVAPDKKNKNLK